MTSPAWRRSSTTTSSCNFTTSGTWDDIADEIVAKYGGIATRVVSYFTGSDVVRDPAAFERWGTLAKAVHAKSASF